MSERRTWWGQFQIPAGSCATCQIGPLTLWVERLESEWRLASELHGGPSETRVDVDLTSPELDLLGLETAARYGVSGAGDLLVVSPQLADRPVVTEPERAFHVAGRETVVVYVGSPLWVRIAPAGGTFSHEMPILRPSDTWFGPNTRQGELCYASRTACRLRLEDVQIKPHRALTKVTIRNDSLSDLRLERMKLPVGLLSLYQGQDGALWTEDIELVRLPGEELAPMEVTRGAPRAARGTPALCAPRREPTENLVVRAFSSFFQ